MGSKETLGQRLQRLRIASHLTQEQLATKSGVPVWSLRNWEHDHRLPVLVAVYKLAKALGVPMEELAICAVEMEGTARVARTRRT